jgi:hypothetical protein
MTITAEQLSPNQPWTLWVDGLGGKAIAGPRLFRAPPWPDIRWSCGTQAEAEVEADKLRKYLSALPVKKTTKKKSSAMSAYQD